MALPKGGSHYNRHDGSWRGVVPKHRWYFRYLMYTWCWSPCLIGYVVLQRNRNFGTGKIVWCNSPGGASYCLHRLAGQSEVKFLHSLCARTPEFHALREVNPEVLFSWVGNNLQDAKCWSEVEPWIHYTWSFLMEERNSLFHRIPLLYVIFARRYFLFSFKLKCLYFSLWNVRELKNKSSFI